MEVILAALVTGMCALGVAYLHQRGTARQVSDLHDKWGNGMAERLVASQGRIEGSLSTHMTDSARRHEETHRVAVEATRVAHAAKLEASALRADVHHWQNRDRVDAEGMRAALTEVGIDTNEGVL